MGVSIVVGKAWKQVTRELSGHNSIPPVEKVREAKERWDKAINSQSSDPVMR